MRQSTKRKECLFQLTMDGVCPCMAQLFRLNKESEREPHAQIDWKRRARKKKKKRKKWILRMRWINCVWTCSYRYVWFANGLASLALTVSISTSFFIFFDFFLYSLLSAVLLRFFRYTKCAMRWCVDIAMMERPNTALAIKFLMISSVSIQIIHDNLTHFLRYSSTS